MLSIPAQEGVNFEHSDKEATVEGVKLNPALSDFQRLVAEETLKLVLGTTGLPDCIVYAILGCLSPLDVMKQTDDVDKTP